MRRRILLLLLASFLSCAALASEKFTVEVLFSHPRITGLAPSSPVWSPDGKKLSFLWNEEGNRFRDLYVTDLSGKVVRLTNLKDLPRDELAKDERTEGQKRDEIELDGGLSSPFWSRDGKWIYFSYRGDLFRIQPEEGSQSERLFETSESESRFSLSRDGRWIAYSSASDIFALETATGHIVQFTRDGSDDLINGGSAYDTYLEGAFWAPDSRKFAFVQYDITDFDRLLIPDYTAKKVEVRKQQREVAGGKLPLIKVGVVNPDSAHKIPLWLKLPEKEQYYLRSLDWSPDSKQILLEAMPRAMQERFILLADAATGKVDTLWHEADPCWIADNTAQVRFGPDGKSIIFGSENSGWCHLYLLPLGVANPVPRALTSGEWEIEGDWTISEDRRVLLYTSSQDHPAERHLFRIDLPDGSPRRVTTESGWISSFVPTDDGSQAAVIFADLQTPYDLHQCQTKAQKPLRRLTHSQPEAFAHYDWLAPQYINIPTSDGQSFPAKLWLPLDGAKPAPMVVYIHGAGYAQNVDKAPWGFDDKFHRLMAQQGFAVVDIDYRGSSGYGRQWRVDVYRHLGSRDLDDAVDAAKYCVQQGWADSTRIGIWGWSYGGFLTNMAKFKRPDIFKVGCSVAAVNDWRNYNLWYTTQRFTFPDRDSVAYAQSSPITYADGLQGKLLLVHGLQDDNVHAQDTMQLIDRLIHLGKQFDLLIYPREDHGFQRDESDMHVMRAILEYFQSHLK